MFKGEFISQKARPVFYFLISSLKMPVGVKEEKAHEYDDAIK